MINKGLQIFTIASITIGLLLSVMTVMDFDDMTCTDCWQFENLIVYCYILTGLLVVAAVGGTLLKIARKPQSLKEMAIGVAAMVVLFGISYGMASDQVLPSYGEITADTAKMSDAGLIATYIMLACSGLAIVFSSVMKLVRR